MRASSSVARTAPSAYEPWVAVAAGALAWWPIFEALGDKIFAVGIAVWMAARARKRGGQPVLAWLLVLYFSTCLGSLTTAATLSLSGPGLTFAIYATCFLAARVFVGTSDGNAPTYLTLRDALLAGAVIVGVSGVLAIVPQLARFAPAIATIGAGVVAALSVTPRHVVREGPSQSDASWLGIVGIALIMVSLRRDVSMFAACSACASIAAAYVLRARAQTIDGATSGRVLEAGEALVVDAAGIGPIRVHAEGVSGLALGESVTLVGLREREPSDGPFRAAAIYEAELWPIDREEARTLARNRAYAWLAWGCVSIAACIAAMVR